MGMDNIDVIVVVRCGIVVCNVLEYLIDGVVVLVVAYASAVAVGLCERYAALRKGDW